jgi:hypothetical protein
MGVALKIVLEEVPLQFFSVDVAWRTETKSAGSCEDKSGESTCGVELARSEVKNGMCGMSQEGWRTSKSCYKHVMVRGI